MENMLIDFLNDYYQANLEIIHDVAGNQHLAGYSTYHQTNLFVKIFKDQAMFYAEQHVDQVYCPDIFIGTVIFGDNYVVVLKDRQLTEVELSEMNEQRSYLYGRLLAEFHQKVTGKVAVPVNSDSLTQQIKFKLAALTDPVHQQQAKEVYSLIEADLPAAQREYQKLKKVVLHGDFSLRNIMHQQQGYVLLDFERAHLGCQYEDFIKFFFTEVTDKKLRQSFIAGYQSLLEFEIPQKACQQTLLYLTALDIYLFHESHTEKKFGEIADQMLATISSGVPVLEI